MRVCRKVIAPILLTFAVVGCIAVACVATFILEWVWIPYLFLSFIPIVLFATTRKHFGGYTLLWGFVLLGFFIISSPYMFSPSPIPAAIVVDELGKVCFGCDTEAAVPSLFFAWDGLIVGADSEWSDRESILGFEYDPSENTAPFLASTEVVSIEIWDLQDHGVGEYPVLQYSIEDPSKPELFIDFAASGTSSERVRLVEGERRTIAIPSELSPVLSLGIARTDQFSAVVTKGPVILIPLDTRSSYWEHVGDSPVGTLALTDFPEVEPYVLRNSEDATSTLLGAGVEEHLYVLREVATSVNLMVMPQRQMWLEEGDYYLYGSAGTFETQDGVAFSTESPFLAHLTIRGILAFVDVNRMFASIVRVKNDMGCECFLWAFESGSDEDMWIDTVLRMSRGRIELNNEVIPFSEYDEIEFWSAPPKFDRFTHDSGGFAFAGDVLAIFRNGQVIKGPYLWDAIPEHFRTLSIVFLGTLFAALLAYWFVRPAYRRRSSDGP